MLRMIFYLTYSCIHLGLSVVYLIGHVLLEWGFQLLPWASSVTFIAEVRNAYRVLVGKLFYWKVGTWYFTTAVCQIVL
jgi:hypothetical protein